MPFPLNVILTLKTKFENVLKMNWDCIISISFAALEQLLSETLKFCSPCFFPCQITLGLVSFCCYQMKSFPYFEKKVKHKFESWKHHREGDTALFSFCDFCLFELMFLFIWKWLYKNDFPMILKPKCISDFVINYLSNC